MGLNLAYTKNQLVSYLDSKSNNYGVDAISSYAIIIIKKKKKKKKRKKEKKKKESPSLILACMK